MKKLLLPIGIVAVALLAGSAGVLASSYIDRHAAGDVLAVSPADASTPNETDEANQTGDQGQKGESGEANQTGDQGQKGESGQSGESGQVGEGDTPAAPTK